MLGEGRRVIWISETDETDQQLLSQNFPSLVEGKNFKITSPRTTDYNCLSWALGLEWAWYSPEPKVAGYYWLPGVPREWTLSTIKLIFLKHGYTEETSDRTLEPGWDKVAFYGDIHGFPHHFARQLPSGAWTSKMARLNDIEHFDLACLEGEADGYGPVILILKRRRKDEQISD